MEDSERIGVIKDPMEIAISEAYETLADDDRCFICEACGDEFYSKEDVEFHLFFDHDFITCREKDGNIIPYSEFLSRISTAYLRIVWGEKNGTE
jgi:hypothetical protein